MQSESTKLVFTGLLVGAVAIGAYVTQSGKHWLSTDEFGVSRDDTSSSQQSRADTMSGTVIPAPATEPARNGMTDSLASDLQAARENHLRAARESLQRNDLVAAQSQLNAVPLGDQDDAQIRALQQEVQMRALASMAADGTAQAMIDAPRGASSTLSKNARTHASHTTARGHSGRQANYANTRLTGNTRVASAGGGSTVGGRASSARPMVASGSRSPVPTKDAYNGAAAKSSTSAAATQQQAIQQAGSQTAPHIASQTAPPVEPASSSISAPLAQTPPSPPSPVTAEPLPQPASRPAPTAALTAQAGSHPALTQSSMVTGTVSGPMTRAQVRAEIARARSDGGLPRFGNPDPAGPGGAPSLTIAPRP